MALMQTLRAAIDLKNADPYDDWKCCFDHCRCCYKVGKWRLVELHPAHIDNNFVDITQANVSLTLQRMTVYHQNQGVPCF